MLRFPGRRQPDDVQLMRAGITRRLLGDRRGLALTEFALALPFLTTAVFVGLETAWLVIQQQTVGRITSQTADNVARIRDSIDETDLYETMAAARLNAGSIGAMGRSRIIISSVQLNAAGNGQWIRWQRCFGSLAGMTSVYGTEGKGQTNASMPAITSNGRTIQATAGMAIILVEMRHTYQPLISDSLFGPKVLKTETAYVVRQRTDLGLNNSTLMTEDRKLKC